jgi:DNA invertase Pin-like site-specific DNA recombinase
MAIVNEGGATAVVGYVRVSRVGARGGDSFLSPALQREEIARVAAREGLDVVEVVEELDASGGDARRPGWNRALEMVESGRVRGIVVWNLSRFTRSLADGVAALARIEGAGGRLYSATEQFGDDAGGRMYRNILLAIAENERDRHRANFRAAVSSALDRGIHVAGTIPFGYRRGPDRRLVPNPDTSPVLVGLFERRARGEGWGRLQRWAAEQGHDLSTTGIAGMLSNPTYLGQVRAGDLVREDAHPALVTRRLFEQCQYRGQRKSSRDGYLTKRYLLAGVATCANCGKYLRLGSGNNRDGTKNSFYRCRNTRCDAKGHAQAPALDAFVLNTLEERLDPADPAGWVARPGGDDANVEEAEAALEDARADLDGYLSDTRLRRTLGEETYNARVSDYVAVVNKAEADLAVAREASSGSFELVGRLWNTEWGWAERKEWLERMVRSVVVSRGREPLSRRCEVELR